jgi:hypothetical protein
VSTGSTSSVVGDVWAQVTTVAPAPALGLVVAAAAVALAVALVPGLWRRSRHLVTIAHEGAHGVAALLSGRRLAGIRLHSDTSGLTVSKGRSSGPGMVVTAGAGYVGPALVGLGAAYLLSRGYAVGVLWGLLALLAALLLQIRNFFGLWSVLVAGAGLFAVTWWAPAQVQLFVSYGVRARARVRRGHPRPAHPGSRPGLGRAVPPGHGRLPGARRGAARRVGGLRRAQPRGTPTCRPAGRRCLAR